MLMLILFLFLTQLLMLILMLDVGQLWWLKLRSHFRPHQRVRHSRLGIDVEDGQVFQ